MNTPNGYQKDSIKDEVLREIKRGGVVMHSRRYFFVRATLSFLVGLTLLLGFFYVASAISFAVGKAAAWDASLHFGAFGWYELFFALPWVIILFVIGIILLLEWFLRKHSSLYRLPVLYSLTALLFVGILGAFALNRMELHARIHSFSVAHGLVPIEVFYEAVDMDRTFRVIHGGIIENRDDGVTIIDESGRPMQVMFNERTYFPDGRGFATSDIIMVFGNSDDATVHAHGARPSPLR